MDTNSQPKLTWLIIIPIVIILGVIFTYPKDSEIKKNTKDNVQSNTIYYFQSNLKPTMTLEDIKLKFGEPQQDLSTEQGAHIYVYPLLDGGKVTIGYRDKIIYANAEDVSGVQSRVIDIPTAEIAPIQTAPGQATLPGVPSCKDTCGDGKCQEVVCQGSTCPCPENTVSCPKDCDDTSY
jgi:hypothetical protein